jgi:hypothetical protein
MAQAGIPDATRFPELLAQAGPTVARLLSGGG